MKRFILVIACVLSACAIFPLCKHNEYAIYEGTFGTSKSCQACNCKVEYQPKECSCDGGMSTWVE